MRFVVDECAGPALARWLTEQGHDVFSVFDRMRGATDDSILELALNENRILITLDRDFSYKVFRQRRAHRGIVYLRLRDERLAAKQVVMQRLLQQPRVRLELNFVVVTESAIRIVEIHSP